MEKDSKSKINGSEIPRGLGWAWLIGKMAFEQWLEGERDKDADVWMSEGGNEEHFRQKE